MRACIWIYSRQPKELVYVYNGYEGLKMAIRTVLVLEICLNILYVHFLGTTKYLGLLNIEDFAVENVILTPNVTVTFIKSRIPEGHRCVEVFLSICATISNRMFLGF